jgi:hypothetical protein
MYLWNPTTGGLYLWTLLTAADNYDGTATLTYSSTTIKASGWNTGALTVQAADINNDGTADLWATGPGPTTTAYLLTAPSTLTAQPAQTLTTANHAWALADVPVNTGGGLPVDATNPAKDNVAALNLTSAGTGTARWNTGDAYSPDVTLDTTSALTTGTGRAVTTNADFTVSAWVKPTATGGVVLSQDGSATAAFKLWAESSDSSWRFAISSSNIASPTWYTAAAAPHSVQLGLWTQLTASYQATRGILNLYVNGVNVSNTTHIGLWPATGPFQVGRVRTSTSAYGSYLSGQISQIQTWSQVIDPAQDITPAGYYQPVPQTRILDTRSGIGGTTGPITPDSTVKLSIAGIAGVATTNVTAVAINITALSGTGNGYVNAYPDNTPRPVTSNLNYPTSTAIANYVIVPVGNNGKIDLFNHGYNVQLLADITGYFTTDATKTGDTTFTPKTPATRILDTRYGTGAPLAKLGQGATLAVTVAGANGIPTGITAVAMNTTTVNQTANSYLITYADGTTRPAVSGLQFTTAGALSNMSIIPVAANGKIDIFNNAGSTDVIGDVVGYFTTGTTGQKYHSIAFARMIDTRQTTGAVPAGTIVRVAQGNTVIALNPTLITNITAVPAATSLGYLTAYPDGTTRPTASNINFPAGQTVPGLSLTPTGANATIDLYNSSSSANIIVDCLGYFSTS